MDLNDIISDTPYISSAYRPLLHHKFFCTLYMYNSSLDRAIFCLLQVHTCHISFSWQQTDMWKKFWEWLTAGMIILSIISRGKYVASNEMQIIVNN